MSRPRTRRTDAALRGLDRMLSALERIPDRDAVEDAERYICAHCSLPLRTCGTDTPCACPAKMREGTVLTAYRRQTGPEKPRCLSCGRPIAASVLRRTPLTELCAACRRAPTPPVHQRRKEGRHGPKTRGA